MNKIKYSQVIFPDKTRFLIEYSHEVVDLIDKLLCKDASQRIGSQNDYMEILEHPWFADIDIGALERFEIPAPIIPRQNNTNRSSVNFSNFNHR